MRTQEISSSKMKVIKAQELKLGQYVAIPQHPTGILLVHKVDDVEIIDDGKWVEITIDNGRKHLLGHDDQILVLF